MSKLLNDSVWQIITLNDQITRLIFLNIIHPEKKYEHFPNFKTINKLCKSAFFLFVLDDEKALLQVVFIHKSYWERLIKLYFNFQHIIFLSGFWGIFNVINFSSLCKQEFRCILIKFMKWIFILWRIMSWAVRSNMPSISIFGSRSCDKELSAIL